MIQANRPLCGRLSVGYRDVLAPGLGRRSLQRLPLCRSPEPGFVEGQNLVIEYRSAEEHLDRLPALVADLMRRPAEVIVGNTPFGARNDDGAIEPVR
jgi:hypothetical protein